MRSIVLKSGMYSEHRTMEWYFLIGSCYGKGEVVRADWNLHMVRQALIIPYFRLLEDSRRPFFYAVLCMLVHFFDILN